MDVILTLVTNTALGDGVAPDMRLMRPDFPYFGEPHPTAVNSAMQLGRRSERTDDTAAICASGYLYMIVIKPNRLGT